VGKEGGKNDEMGKQRTQRNAAIIVIEGDARGKEKMKDWADGLDECPLDDTLIMSTSGEYILLIQRESCRHHMT